MGLIFHIAERQEWEAGRTSGSYEPAGFAKDGFIHCSLRHQMLRVAGALFRGRDDLVLLAIEEDRVQPKIRYEAMDTTDAFPHVYGRLNLDAIAEAVPWEVKADGSAPMPNEEAR